MLCKHAFLNRKYINLVLEIKSRAVRELSEALKRNHYQEERVNANLGCSTSGKDNSLDLRESVWCSLCFFLYVNEVQFSQIVGDVRVNQCI